MGAVGRKRSHKYCYVHTNSEKFENGFGFVFEENSGREIEIFRRVPFSKCFPPTLKRKALWRFQIPLV